MLAATIIGTFLTKPSKDEVVLNFYKTTRPFGFWKPFRNRVDADIQKSMKKEHRNDIITLPFSLGWQITLFLWPMQLVIHAYRSFIITFSIFLTCLIVMYFTWYRNLPAKGKAFSDETKKFER